MMYNYIKSDPAVRTAAHVSAHASHMINRAGTLLNYGFGSPPSFQEIEQYSLSSKSIQLDEYTDEDTEALNKRGRDNLNNLYKRNQKFREGIINFISDETEFSNEKIIDKRYKYNTLNKLGMDIFAQFAFSKDHARSLTGILASYN